MRTVTEERIADREGSDDGPAFDPMSYQLRIRQNLGENLSRIFREQIDGALAIARGGSEPPDTRVHALRKHLKKARAVLQLARKEITGFGPQDRRLRDAGRITREIRDAEVRLQTVRQLEDVMHRHDRSYQKIERLLAAELEEVSAAFGRWEKQVIPPLAQAREKIEGWSIKDYAGPALQGAVQRTYKGARKAMVRARAKPDVANIHQLRKEVKLLGYQLRIVSPLNPIVIGALSDELTDLAHLLGRVHDLSFLAQRLRREQASAYWARQDDELLAMIETSQAELQRDGIQIAEMFFAKKASDFGLLVAAWIAKSNRQKKSAVARALVAG